MTKRGILYTDPDGTRHYSGGVTYKPKPLEERKYKIRKPDHPRAVRYKGDWFTPLPVIPMGFRKMPDTRPDAVIIQHRFLCQCRRCQVPGILRAKRRLHGLHIRGTKPFESYVPADLLRFEGLTPPQP